jgi:hypothetical protein
MSPRAPLAVRLPQKLVVRTRSVTSSLVAELGPRVSRHLIAAFEFKSDELPFVRHLLARKSNLWAFRSNQKGFCGDFVVVDMSAACPRRRATWVIDLKLGAPLKLGGGGAGVSFQNAPGAVAEIARRTGALSAEAPVELVCGDRREVLSYLGA